ncbi:MAG: hypothetical protein DI527_22710 [Chelatococcus sp.]|nr:MAG: hypothetical protein DI527_22710 [Chelatococcus sp.]
MGLAVDDVARSLRGSWGLMTRGREALPELDLSREGFWRSFAAYVLMAPATVAVLAAARLAAGLRNEAGLFGSAALDATVVLAQCGLILALPLCMLALRPALLRTPRFTSFVIAWNWAGIVSSGLMALPAGVFALGWSTPHLALAQASAFAVIVLRLRYCVARAAFGADGRVALLLVAASVLADIAIIRLLVAALA